MSRIFRLLGLPLFLSGALVYPMQPANFNRAVGQPPHAVASIDQLKHLYDEILGFLKYKADSQIDCKTMYAVRFIIDTLSLDEIKKESYELLSSSYVPVTENLKRMAAQDGCPEIFKKLSDQMCTLFEKVLIEREVILRSPTKSFYPTNWSKVVGAERKGLKVSTQQSPESSESSWSPLSSDLSPVVQVALSLLSSNQSSNSSTPTPVETPRQSFIPIDVITTSATHTNSGQGLVTHREYRFGRGVDIWSPIFTPSVTISPLCVERDERRPGYYNGDSQ